MKFIRIRTILSKQIKETFANKEILIQFLLLPAFACILTNVIQMDDLPHDFFVKMFGAMYIGMAPLVTTASILAEEKESNTLRMLLFSNVKAGEYLFGISLYVFVLCSIGSVIIAMVGGYALEQFLVFVLLSQIGIIISILLGACVGFNAKNQMGATASIMPLMLILAFMPMLATFNETIKKFGDFIYTQQINVMFDSLSFAAFTSEFFLVTGGSVLFAIGLFFYSYRKKGIRI